MKTYANKSNAKRAGVAKVAKDLSLDKKLVASESNKYFEIVGEKGAFYPEYKEIEAPALKASATVETENKEVEKVNEHFEPEIKLELPEKKGTRKTGKGLKIEKVREERNGITRPSIGGKCRAIWDTCDEIYSTGEMPMPKLIKGLAEKNNWNINNAIIELYQWRKFNGIVGRQK